MARRLRPDSMLFVATLVLVCVSMAWVYSASMGRTRAADVTAFAFFKQVMWAALGLATLLIAARIDFRTYRSQMLMLALAAVTLVGLVLVFFFRPIGGSHRWVRLSDAVGLQPSELAKLLAVMVSASLLAERVENRDSLNPALLRIVSMFAVFAALILPEPDLGSVLIMGAVLVAIAFAAGMPYRYLTLALAGSCVLGAAAIVAKPYRLQRVIGYLTDPPFQTKQALIAVGSGGTWGRGFAQSVQKMFYLPASQTDSIFAVIGEEAGLIGTTIVLVCFAIIIWRGLRVAFNAPDVYGTLLATGITALIGVQAALNMSVVLNLVPQKGVALPFVSAGGSSLLVSLVAMGILLNLSQHASYARDHS